MLPDALQTTGSDLTEPFGTARSHKNFLKCDSGLSKRSGIVQPVCAQPLSFSTSVQLPAFWLSLIIRRAKVQCGELQQKVIHSLSLFPNPISDEINVVCFFQAKFDFIINPIKPF